MQQHLDNVLGQFNASSTPHPIDSLRVALLPDTVRTPTPAKQPPRQSALAPRVKRFTPLLLRSVPRSEQL